MAKIIELIKLKGGETIHVCPSCNRCLLLTHLDFDTDISLDSFGNVDQIKLNISCICPRCNNKIDTYVKVILIKNN